MERALKTSETVARDIVHDIVARGLATGDRLSSEAAMLEQYRVSRESLREGLRLLEVQELITIRRGPVGGPVVGKVDSANLGRISTLFYHLAGGTYAELFDAWIVSEGVLADRAARNRDVAAVKAAMAPFCTQDTTAGTEDVEGFIDTHLHFHAVVAEMGRNRVLELLLQTVSQIVTHHILVTADPRDVRDLVARDHADVAQAIAAGHPEEARSRMEEHIRNVGAFYSRLVGAQMDNLIEWR